MTMIGPQKFSRSNNSAADREGFSSRLNATLISLGIDCGATNFSREYNRRFPLNKVTVYAARKWLNGDAIPAQANLRSIAEWTGISPEWLRYGTSPGVGNDLPNAHLEPIPSQVANEMRSLSSSAQLLVLEFVRTLEQLS